MPVHEMPTPFGDPSRPDTAVLLEVSVYGPLVSEGFRDDLCQILEQDGFKLTTGAERPLDQFDDGPSFMVMIKVDHAIDALMHAVRKVCPRGALLDFRLIVEWNHNEEDGSMDWQEVCLVTEPVPGLI